MSLVLYLLSFGCCLQTLIVPFLRSVSPWRSSEESFPKLTPLPKLMVEILVFSIEFSIKKAPIKSGQSENEIYSTTLVEDRRLDIAFCHFKTVPLMLVAAELLKVCWRFHLDEKRIDDVLRGHHSVE